MYLMWSFCLKLLVYQESFSADGSPVLKVWTPGSVGILTRGPFLQWAGLNDVISRQKNKLISYFR